MDRQPHPPHKNIITQLKMWLKVVNGGKKWTFFVPFNENNNFKNNVKILRI